MKGILSTPIAFYNNFQRQEEEEEEVKTVMQTYKFDHDFPFVIRFKLMKFIFMMAQYWQRENSLVLVIFYKLVQRRSGV